MMVQDHKRVNKKDFQVSRDGSRPKRFTPPVPVDRHKMKTEEIKRSLIHRARVRKAYFKMLEKEGEHVERTDKGERRKQNKRGSKDTVQDEEDSKVDKTVRKGKSNLKSNTKQDEIPKNTSNSLDSKLNHAQLRTRHHKQMTKYTPKGQPVLGARVSRLLDKIKEGL